jgi:hypothetical protein
MVERVNAVTMVWTLRPTDVEQRHAALVFNAASASMSSPCSPQGRYSSPEDPEKAEADK